MRLLLLGVQEFINNVTIKHHDGEVILQSARIAKYYDTNAILYR